AGLARAGRKIGNRCGACVFVRDVKVRAVAAEGEAFRIGTGFVVRDGLVRTGVEAEDFFGPRAAAGGLAERDAELAAVGAQADASRPRSDVERLRDAVGCGVDNGD